MSRIVRLNESDVERLVRKIIKENKINELGTSDFTDTVKISGGSSVLKPAIAKLRGKNHIVVIDNKGEVFGYGPEITKNMGRNEICIIANNLVSQWDDEAKMNEADTSNFIDVKPITFCSNKK
jgi:hypothetical protein